LVKGDGRAGAAVNNYEAKSAQRTAGRSFPYGRHRSIGRGLGVALGTRRTATGFCADSRAHETGMNQVRFNSGKERKTEAKRVSWIKVSSDEVVFGGPVRGSRSIFP